MKVKSTLLAALSLVAITAASVADAQESAQRPATSTQSSKGKAVSKAAPVAGQTIVNKNGSVRAQSVQNTRAAPAVSEAIITKPKSSEFDSGCHSKDSDA